ncbi:serine hydrolase domain-containing protein [Hyphococcus sp.]|uniref:serine hydrolase domain-containing protein n=1 Tax=Hyphococcus sp. TaxID=2038636 RepID=UPI003D136CE0
MISANQPAPRRRIAPRHRFAALCLALAPLPACAAEDAPPVVETNQKERRIEAAKARLEEMNFKGVVAIAYDGEAPVYAGFGEGAVQGTPDETTLLDSGSITKTFTAAAALKLIDEGKLQTSDRLEKFFPEAPADKAKITVHQILTHSAGLPPAVGEDLDYLPKDEFLKRAFAAPLLFEPGSAYEYSNVGYSLVAAIIETLSGKNYETYIREDLLAGIDATEIGYEAAFDATRSMMTADGETIDEASWGGRSHWALIGNGGMLVTAQDMIAFRRAFAARKLHSNAAVNLGQTPMVREGEGAPTFAGYGMVVDDHPQFGRVYWHNGGNPHFISNWSDFADHGVIIFASSDGVEVNGDMAVEAIAAELLLTPGN